VSDLVTVKRRLQGSGVKVSEEGAGVIQFLDPEENRVVVSQTGWTK
jgi:hypothetical protein